ncbi:MAG: hypothetical protein ACREPM_04275, partial [Gemmatimonadaceae bacterium]
VAGVPATTVNGNRAPATHGTTYIVEQTGSGQAQQAVLVDLAPITWVLDPVSDQPVSTLAVTVDGVLWVEVEDLIDSDAASQQYRTSRDNDGYVTVHFGDDEFGAAPPLGAPIVVRCRIGIGNAGHVARDTLTEFDSSLSPGITLVRNPLAASQPREPQSLAQAKLVGPAQLRVQNRAVVPEDFEALVAGGVRVNAHVVAPLQSKARMTHTGSWNTVVVSVDMPDRQPIDTATRSAFESFLETKKMAGLDVQVEDARYCPVHIALRVDVEAEHFARDVRGAVERALVGTHARGFAFFDPGRLTFGQPVYLSDLYGAVMAVPGVSAVAVTRFKRLGDRYPDNEAQGFIPVGALEVARLDNDPSAPQFGVLYVRTCGGKEG